MRCGACGREDPFDFHVPDAVWEAVVPKELWGEDVCLGCFDRMAGDVEYLEEMDPVLVFESGSGPGGVQAGGKVGRMKRSKAVKSNIVKADEWGEKICKALCLDPGLVERIVIDLPAGEVAKVYVSLYGDRKVMKVTPPDLASAFRPATEVKEG